jgi:hypothetical protein
MWVRRAEFATSIPEGAPSLRNRAGEEFKADTVGFEAGTWGTCAFVFGAREDGGGRASATFDPPFPTWLPEPPLWWADAVAWVEGQE